MIIKQDVPAGIRYLGFWKEFSLKNYPSHAILHKQLPGCGFTEFALLCPEPVVLCSPRKMLMENKKGQHGEDVYLVVNKFEIGADVDEDISKPIPTATISAKDKFLAELLQARNKEEDNTYTRLFQEIYDYLGRMTIENKTPKIIVTYDSTYLVKRVLESMGIIQNFYFCIDEMQSILDDARFKSTTELSFLSVLQQINHVLYVSATPMLDKYLQQIPELASLPYYQLDWGSLDPSRIKKPNLKVRVVKSISGKMSEIIQSYLDGNFEKVVVERDGQFIEVESKEAVFYVNSVNHIIAIIKKMGLTPDQCNILCSDTPFNQSRIDKKLGKRKGYKIGSVPLPWEPHKMFTFCTRTVYLGADFYSLCSRSFIFSDANSDCLSIDISMDLYQILGRERDERNPWKNSAEFYYRTTADYRKMTQEDLNKIIQKKIDRTGKLLNVFSTTDNSNKDILAETYQKVTKMDKYRDDYVAVNKDRVTGVLVPIFNNLVLINDQRAFDIQQIDYADRFNVFTSIVNEFGLENSGEREEITRFFWNYDRLTTYVDKLHMIVDYLIDRPDLSEALIGNLTDSDKIKQQLIVLGPLKIKSLGYNLTYINKAMGITIFDKTTFFQEIYSRFNEGKKYTKKYIKEELGKIYQSAGFEGTAKASDLEMWFELKTIQITDPTTKKRENGFELIKKKDIQ